MGRGGARYVYWLLIVIGSVLLLGRGQELEMLKIVFCIGLPIAVVWICCRFFRLLFEWVASMYVDVEVALSKFVIKHPGLRSWLKIAASLAVVTVASFLYFAGLIALNAPSGVQNPLLATP
jgi:hypothetical protein